MPPKPQDVTDAELAVLQLLWSGTACTVRQLAIHLYGASQPSELATVQKLLGRLESKGFVRRDRGQWPHRFEAVVLRQELICRRLQHTADELCGGSWAPLLTHLVRSDQLDPAQRQQLRSLLDRLGTSGDVPASPPAEDGPPPPPAGTENERGHR